jgi:hypothetical protein
MVWNEGFTQAGSVGAEPESFFLTVIPLRPGRTLLPVFHRNLTIRGSSGIVGVAVWQAKWFLLVN